MIRRKVWVHVHVLYMCIVINHCTMIINAILEIFCVTNFLTKGNFRDFVKNNFSTDDTCRQDAKMWSGNAFAIMQSHTNLEICKSNFL